MSARSRDGLTFYPHCHQRICNQSGLLLQEDVGTKDSDFALGHHVAAHYLLQNYLSNLR